MESLKVLHADGAAINQLPSTSSDIKSWHSCWFSWVSRPKKSPESISPSLDCLSRSLVSLSLADCNLSDDAIPTDLGCLSLLQILNLGGNPICSLPDSIKGLIMLQSLHLQNCTKLQLLPELPMSLQKLDLSECRSLEIITNLPNLLKSLFLIAFNCDKLVEVQKLFRLEPIRNVDAEMIKNLGGLVEMESMGKVEVKLYNGLTLTNRIGPIQVLSLSLSLVIEVMSSMYQGLYECGIFSIFLPGDEVPAWFSNKSTMSSIYLNVPSLPNCKIRGLNVSLVYAYDSPSNNISHGYWNASIIRTFNKTKDLKWTYCPTFIGIPDVGKNMIWSSHWKIGNHLEVGDEVVVSVILWRLFQVKEFGVHIVYEKEEHGSYNSCLDVIDAVDLSVYQVSRGTYFLCQYDFGIHQLCSTDDGWNTTGWYDFLFGDSVGNKLHLSKFSYRTFVKKISLWSKLKILPTHK